jgi:hypothetical protein
MMLHTINRKIRATETMRIVPGKPGCDGREMDMAQQSSTMLIL